MTIDAWPTDDDMAERCGCGHMLGQHAYGLDAAPCDLCSCDLFHDAGACAPNRHVHPADEPPTLDEVHITLEQFEDEIVYEDDGTAVLFGGELRHRCPPGTPCAMARERA